MFKIVDDIIYITRGDNAVLEITSYTDEDEQTEYELQEGDTYTFTVRQVASQKSPVVFQVTSGTKRIIISQEDTKDAQVGKYSADIQLNTASGDTKTIWPKFDVVQPSKEFNFKNFCIMPEVTMT